MATTFQDLAVSVLAGQVMAARTDKAAVKAQVDYVHSNQGRFLKQIFPESLDRDALGAAAGQLLMQGDPLQSGAWYRALSSGDSALLGQKNVVAEIRAYDAMYNGGGYLREAYGYPQAPFLDSDMPGFAQKHMRPALERMFAYQASYLEAWAGGQIPVSNGGEYIQSGTGMYLSSPFGGKPVVLFYNAGFSGQPYFAYADDATSVAELAWRVNYAGDELQLASARGQSHPEILSLDDAFRQSSQLRDIYFNNGMDAVEQYRIFTRLQNSADQVNAGWMVRGMAEGIINTAFDTAQWLSPSLQAARLAAYVQSGGAFVPAHQVPFSEPPRNAAQTAGRFMGPVVSSAIPVGGLAALASTARTASAGRGMLALDKWGSFRAANTSRPGVRIATDGPSSVPQGTSQLLNDIRASGGTFPINRGQVSVQNIAEASRAGGREIAYYRDRSTGQLYLRELGPQMGEIPEGSRLILHTQPGSMPLSVQPSTFDRAALTKLGQRSSVIVNFDGTYAIRFRPNNAGDGSIRWIGSW